MWFLGDGKERKGPFSVEQMKEFLDQGKLNRNTPVWRQGMQSWQPLGTTELVNLIPGSPPDMPASSPDVKATTQAAYEKAREATGHAITAIKLIIIDPMGGQGNAWKILGPDRGMLAGIACLVLYVGLPFIFSLLQGYGKETLGDMVKLIIFFLLVPGLVGFVSYILGMLGAKKASIQAAIFTSGIAMLPLVLIMAITFLVGISNFEVILVVGIFGITSFCLLLNAGLTQVHELSSKISFWAVPLVIAVCLYGAKIFIFRELMNMWETVMMDSLLM